jgi:hypothetical protein
MTLQRFGAGTFERLPPFDLRQRVGAAPDRPARLFGR